MDLFDYVKQLRDEGMAVASAAQDSMLPAWSTAAYAAILSIARHQPTVHVDDVLMIFHRRPAHYNAWGAVWMKAIKAGVLARTGTVRQCSVDPGKHAHQYPIYRSMVFTGS